MKTALITHKECLNHITPPGNPEQVARLERILEALAPLELNRVNAPMAADDDLLRIHPKSHINALHDAAPEPGDICVSASMAVKPASGAASCNALICDLG